VLGTLPAFALVERSGRPLTREDLVGSAWVADFIFTRCAGTCPLMTARMRRLQRDLPRSARLVSFSVDPEHDRAEVLAEYARRAEAGPGWLFATGAPADVRALAISGFKLAAEAVPPEQQAAGGDGPFLHSSKFVLVDAAARIRGYYDSLDETALARLRLDFARLGREGS
jgi:cytochrome oxidase Cu insertion factor (SCO1/SenC/PrrC family)